jgi:hypothetical protein
MRVPGHPHTGLQTVTWLFRESYAPPALNKDGVRVLVFLGSLLGHTSPVTTYSPLLGAEITLAVDGTLRLEVDPTFEHGVLVDTGQVTVADTAASPGQLIYLPVGRGTLTLEAPAGEPALRPMNRHV